ncbi:ABC transporter permease [Agromyces sp. SYSU K20354]|uniref:FtsX-like permease family protein n=1 Tax=Agromyces cavernae TaxID=2898659 RepID=UPI001E4ECB9A|nr:FtsX-like permease family protein [Agromyces cavernae]MCD2442629.1 ABC transporter permease [Agromyces cavernae]
MLTRYVVTDLWRNPRRTLSALIGVSLGIGLFCGVLFFVDGLSASMTQRAVQPLALDMQRIVTEKAADGITLTQQVEGTGVLRPGDRTWVDLTVRNDGEVQSNDVTIRSMPADGLNFVVASAALDGQPITGFSDNPLASGQGKAGFNLGTLAPGATHSIRYAVESASETQLDDSSVASTYSSRESVLPVAANRAASAGLTDLATRISELPGVAHASELSFADLGSDALTTASSTAFGPTRIFGFDEAYAGNDETISIVAGGLSAEGAVVSAEAADALGVAPGDPVTVALPDGSELELEVTGVADLSRSRSLFSSRRGGDLETFIYSRNAVIVSPPLFAERIFPAYERAIAQEGAGRFKNPPLREIDITVDRELLDADPATAVGETRAIAAEVMGVAAPSPDHLLDNITNTLDVATGDASTAKSLFVFLGVPGGLLAAILAAYSGSVLAHAQRREQATLRIRGASRRHLLRMLAVRTGLLTSVGAIIGLVAGYFAASIILGQESLARASSASLITSAWIGTLGGFLATGLALYLTGRRSIDQEINEDRALLRERAPLWQRLRLDLVAVAVLVLGTVIALRMNAFSGQSGSVYFGRSVELNLALLFLPLAAWLAGSLIIARLTGGVLTRLRPPSRPTFGRPAPGLVRRSVGRRPWAISTGTIVVSLIVGLAVSLAAFTASYDAAKAADARYANGSDIKISPSPTSSLTYAAGDAEVFRTEHISEVTPVIYGVNNVILRSARTSDPASLAAVDPSGFAAVAPVDEAVATMLTGLEDDPNAILVSEEMADYLHAEVGDPLFVLLVRSTDEQVEAQMTIAGLFERVPGFPDGADAVMNISTHTELVPSKNPDFFLAATGPDEAALVQAVDELRVGPASADTLQIDTRTTTLDRDQSSLAALNISGLVTLDSGFALAMATVTMVVFVFGILLQRRREYVTLRAQGLGHSTVRSLISAEAALTALAGALGGILVGGVMGYYFVMVLRPLFVLTPEYILPFAELVPILLLVLGATLVSSIVASRLVNSLKPTELLRDE